MTLNGAIFVMVISHQNVMTNMSTMQTVNVNGERLDVHKVARNMVCIVADTSNCRVRS